MNTILQSGLTLQIVVRAFSDEDLAKCVQDVIRWQNSDLLGEGILFQLAARFSAEASIDRMSSMEAAEAAVLREASIRFAEAQTGLRAD